MNKYNVMNLTKGWDKNIVGFVVTDVADFKKADQHPIAAEFSISDRYDKQTQELLAQKLCDFLNNNNKIIEDALKNQTIK